DLQELLAAYLARLSAEKLVDYADVLRIAGTRLREDRSLQSASILVLTPRDADLHALERSFLGAFPPDGMLPLPEDEPIRVQSPAIEGHSDLDLLRWLPSPADAPAPFADGTAQCFRAIGEVNEVRQVLRCCLAAGIPFDMVEILHTDWDTYVPLIYE